MGGAGDVFKIKGMSFKSSHSVKFNEKKTQNKVERKYSGAGAKLLS
jgi:hypothetical protein